MNVFWNAGAGITLSNGNLTANVSTMTYTARANVGKKKGKYYWEITFDEGTSASIMIGIVNASAPLTGSASHQSKYARYYWASNGNKYPDAISYGASYGFGDTVGIFLDLDNGDIKFYKNGESQGIAYAGILSLGEVFPAINAGGTNHYVKATANFGATNFKFLPKDLPAGTLTYDESKVLVDSRVLLKSNGKNYSLKSIDVVYETEMTSNTTPAPLVASASSQFGAASNHPYMAFDNQSTFTTWATSNGSKSGWLQLDFGEIKKVFYFSIKVLSSLHAPKTFEMLGSNDGINFNKLGSYEFSNWTTTKKEVFKLNKEEFYRYYRLNILDVINANYIMIENLSFISDRALLEIPTFNKDNFIKYGSSEINNLDKILSSKNYVLQDTVSEDADGLWKTQLNRKPLSIKFE